MADQTIFIDPALLGILFSIGMLYVSFTIDKAKGSLWKPVLMWMTTPVALATGVHLLGHTVNGVEWWIGIFMFLFAVLLSFGGLYYALGFGEK
jgi:cell division protein FtsW (lipid II flippase)